MTVRAFLLCLLTSLSVLPAHAQAGPQDAAASAALAALSARYAQLWSTLPASDRQQLLQSERTWLHVTRWREQRACESGAAAYAAAVASASPEDRAAHCLVQVTERRIAQLPRPSLAAR